MRLKTNKKNRKKDWKLIIGFGVLLLFISAIGSIGIYQVNSFNKRVRVLGEVYFPIQKSILEMKVKSSNYATNIRNYMYWKSSRYLEAAKFSQSPQEIKKPARQFNIYLDKYTGLVKSEEEKYWAQKVRGMHQRLTNLGQRIIGLTDNINIPEISKEEKQSLKGKLNKLIMDFESRLYLLNNFLDNNLQEYSLKSIQQQLNYAKKAKESAVIFLGWSLFLALFVGADIAFLVYKSRQSSRIRQERIVQRMIKFEEKERKNLSFQVHNQMGQDLGALKIYLGIAAQKGADLEELQKCKGILSQLIEKTHNISELLRPPALDEVGLVEVIEDLVSQYEQLSDAEFVFKKPERREPLSHELSLTIYRVVQETLNNVVKYSKANNVFVKLSYKDNNVILNIEDDGVGFNYGKFSQRPHRRREDRVQLGLVGLKERIEVMGGGLIVKTSPGKGTKITVSLPL